MEYKNKTAYFLAVLFLSNKVLIFRLIWYKVYGRNGIGAKINYLLDKLTILKTHPMILYHDYGY